MSWQKESIFALLNQTLIIDGADLECTTMSEAVMAGEAVEVESVNFPERKKPKKNARLAATHSIRVSNASSMPADQADIRFLINIVVMGRRCLNVGTCDHGIPLNVYCRQGQSDLSRVLSPALTWRWQRADR